jgi:hypothetical protein
MITQYMNLQLQLFNKEIINDEITRICHKRN